MPLLEEMTRLDPVERPSALEALEKYEGIISDLPGYVRRQRLKELGKGKVSSLLHDAGTLRRECFFMLRSMFSAYCFLIMYDINIVLITLDPHAR